MAWRLTQKEDKIIALALSHMEKTLSIDVIRKETEDSTIESIDITSLLKRFRMSIERIRPSKSHDFVGED